MVALRRGRVAGEATMARGERKREKARERKRDRATEKGPVGKEREERGGPTSVGRARGEERTAVKAVKYQSRDGSCHRRANIMGGVLN